MLIETHEREALVRVREVADELGQHPGDHLSEGRGRRDPKRAPRPWPCCHPGSAPRVRAFALRLPSRAGCPGGNEMTPDYLASPSFIRRSDSFGAVILRDDGRE